MGALVEVVKFLLALAALGAMLTVVVWVVLVVERHREVLMGLLALAFLTSLLWAGIWLVATEGFVAGLAFLLVVMVVFGIFVWVFELVSNVSYLLFDSRRRPGRR